MHPSALGLIKNWDREESVDKGAKRGGVLQYCNEYIREGLGHSHKSQ